MRKNLSLAACIALACTLMFAFPLEAADKRIDIDVTGRPALGPDGAPVTIIEFLDFQ